jgi:hypothetical protein
MEKLPNIHIINTLWRIISIYGLKLFAFATVRTVMCVHIRKHFPRPLTPGERITYQISLFECGYERESEKIKRKVKKKRKEYLLSGFKNSVLWFMWLGLSDIHVSAL